MAMEARVLDPGEPQAIDSSHLFEAAAVQDPHELLRDGMRTLLEHVPTTVEDDPGGGAEGKRRG